MKLRLVDLLRCPLSGGRLRLQSIETTDHPLSPEDRAEAEVRKIDCATIDKAVKNGILVSDEAKVWYPVVNYVPVMPRFQNQAARLVPAGAPARSRQAGRLPGR